MASYRQWRVNADKGEVRKVTWVCGEATILVEEVVDHVRATLSPSDLDYEIFTAGTSDKDIWASINQYALISGSNRLVVVREANRIRRWQPMYDWLNESRITPNNYLVLVSPETEQLSPTTRPEQEAVRSKGHLVRCSPPNEEDTVAWVMRKTGSTDGVARYLLERTGGDLTQCASVGMKLALFGGQPSTEVIDTLVQESPSDDFAQALIEMKRAKALLALEGLHVSEYSRAIGLLDSRLDLLAKLHMAVRKGLGMREISQLPGVHVFLARQLIPFAKHYAPERVLRARQALCLCDDAIRAGAREAVMESLVALW